MLFVKNVSINPKVVKYVFLVIGFLLLLGSFKFYSDTKSFLDIASRTEGLVIEMIEVKSGNSSTYKPVFEFVTMNGEVVEITSSSSSNPPSYSVGEIVEVLYDNELPNDAKINGFFSLWGFSTVFGILGGIFFSIGLGLISYGIIKSKKLVN